MSLVSGGARDAFLFCLVERAHKAPLSSDSFKSLLSGRWCLAESRQRHSCPDEPLTPFCHPSLARIRAKERKNLSRKCLDELKSEHDAVAQQQMEPDVLSARPHVHNFLSGRGGPVKGGPGLLLGDRREEKLVLRPGL